MKDVNAQYVQMANANLENAVEAAQIAIAGVEKMADLQLKSGRNALSQIGLNLKSLTVVKDAQDLMKVQTSFAQPSIEAALGYTNAMYSIVSETSAALAKLAEAQIASGSQSVHSAVEEFAKSAPVGSESGVAMVKSALNAANDAYQSAANAAKQAAAAVEQNIQSATKASLKAIKAAA